MVYARRGYGTGRGAGYKNLAPNDSYVHSLNRKGVGTYVKRVSTPVIKSKTPHLDAMKVRTDLFSVVTGKAFRKDFGTIPTPVKKGLIKELARNVVKGVKWAVEWEREHLPSQARWVQEEFTKAKDEAVKLGKLGLEKVKEGVEWEKKHLPSQVAWVKKEASVIGKEIKKEATDIEKALKEKQAESELKKEGFEVYDLQKKQDLHDVRDELDTDDDGIQDVSMDELETANKNIVKGLDKIDTDKNGIPDHREDGFTDLRTIKIEPPRPSSDYQETHLQSEEDVHKRIEEAKGSIKAVEDIAKKGFAKTKDFIEREYAIGKKYIQEQQQKAKELHEMNDAELTKLAIQTPKPLWGKNNKYEAELFRRERAKNYIANELHLIDMTETAKYNAMRPLVTSRGVYPSKAQFKMSNSTRNNMGNVDGFFGFADPFNVFRTGGFKIK